jgi:hypothetical protein
MRNGAIYTIVIPAKAGIPAKALKHLDSRFRGNDINEDRVQTPETPRA